MSKRVIAAKLVFSYYALLVETAKRQLVEVKTLEGRVARNLCLFIHFQVPTVCCLEPPCPALHHLRGAMWHP